jgi:HSP20 family protein
LSSETPEWTFSPGIESAWTDEQLHLRAILPGVAEKDLKVSVQGNQLILEGERKAPESFGKNGGYTQLAYGKFYAAYALPNDVDVEKLSCHLRDGVLDIQVPVAETRKPRRIQIQSEERKAIAA